jgi:hypothetical protein
MNDDNNLEQRLYAMRDVAPLEDPAEAVLVRARQLFRLHHPKTESGLVRFARLVQDSFRAPATLAPARGASVSEPRELLFESNASNASNMGGDSLTLRFFQEPDDSSPKSHNKPHNWYVIGQVIGADALPIPSVTVRLENVDDAATQFVSQEMGVGELHVEGVVPGYYQAHITLPNGEVICIPDMQVGVV